MSLIRFGMKKISFFNGLLILFASLQIVACQNEDDKTLLTPDGKVDVSKAVQFKVNFADYNADEQIKSSRAGNTTNDTISRQFVELENGLVADIVIKKDRKPSPKPVATRALENGSYTMLAYKNGTLLDSLKGTVSGGTFTVSDSRDGMGLGVGTYDFILYNDKVTRNGNKLFVKRENMETALIGQTQYTVTASPQKQQVDFVMKHAAARLSIYLEIPNYEHYEIQRPYDIQKADFISLPSTGITSVASYDPATDNWSTDENKEYEHKDISKYGQTYYYFLPSTDFSKVGVRAREGKLFRMDLTAHPIQFPLFRNSTILSANGSYSAFVQVHPKYYYLMSDGTIGLLDKTIKYGGTKTPIGIVLSRSKRLAIAVGPIPGYTSDSHITGKWQTIDNPVGWSNSHQIFNSKVYPSGNLFSALNDLDGEHNTWDASASKDGVTIKANEKEKFPAFYAAAHYGEKLAQRGVHLTNGMENKRWFLPSVGEMAYAYRVLGFGEDNSFPGGSSYKALWYYSLWKGAFIDVDGADYSTDGAVYFFTSTQYDNGYAGMIIFRDQEMEFGDWPTDKSQEIRPFVHY